MIDGTDRARTIFGNIISDKDYAAACKAKDSFIKRFGDDTNQPFHLSSRDLAVIGPALGVKQLVSGDEPFDIRADVQTTGEPVVIGNIRMGFGHYRIAMAMASAAHALGYVPYWLDFCSFPETTCSKVIEYQNNLYSMGSRLSQSLPPFNALYWEPLNSEGFRKLSYNASDQKVSELFVRVLGDLPRDIPFVGTHVWPAQAAVHARFTHVVNAIPDNWPMALHLAEGSLHTVQTPSAYLGYKQLRGMDKARKLAPMPNEAIRYTGHYIDHELVSNIASDCAHRKERLLSGEPTRYLLTVGGAGAQAKLFADIAKHLISYVKAGRATLFINVGDHIKVWQSLVQSVPELADMSTEHMNDFDEVTSFAAETLTGSAEGIHVFYNDDIFAAVYASNLLMRACDVLVTKPSELAFYPVPKLMIHRVGGHEAWGAVRAQEIGDGTYELDDTSELLSIIDSFQDDPALITQMCDNIEKANDIGIYNGAYEVIRLAQVGLEANE